MNKDDDGLLSTKQSIYNNKLFIDSCQICSKNDELDTHHILFQKDSDEEGYINHIHKNNLSNLIVLCKNCHNDVHNGILNIYGYKKTIKGNQIIKEVISEEEKNLLKNKKKFNEEQIKIILEYNKPNYNKKYIIEDLKKRYNIVISLILLNKIFKGEY